MAIYEKWDVTYTTRLSFFVDPDAIKLSKMDGYLLRVDLVSGVDYDPADEKPGDQVFPPIAPPGTTTFLVTAKTAEEIADYQLMLDEQAVDVAIEAAKDAWKDFATNYPDARYFKVNTYAELDTAINNTFDATAASSLNNLALACRAANKKQSAAIKDIAEILAEMIRKELRTEYNI